jgi:hypothetical protein
MVWTTCQCSNGTWNWRRVRNSVREVSWHVTPVSGCMLDREVHNYCVLEGNLEVQRWNGTQWSDFRTRFGVDCLTGPAVVTGQCTCTHTYGQLWWYRKVFMNLGQKSLWWLPFCEMWHRVVCRCLPTFQTNLLPLFLPSSGGRWKHQVLPKCC